MFNHIRVTKTKKQVDVMHLIIGFGLVLVDKPLGDGFDFNDVYQ